MGKTYMSRTQESAKNQSGSRRRHKAEVYLDALWVHILDLVRTGGEEPQDRPRAPDTDESQTYGYVQVHLDDTMTTTQNEAIHYQAPEGSRDIDLVNLMQIGDTSAEDLEWCTLIEWRHQEICNTYAPRTPPKGKC